jgi:hypothetical protein
VAAPIGIRVEGGAKLRRALRDADASMADLKALHSRIGALVAASASGRVPRASGALAGTIRASGTASTTTVRAGYASIPYAGVVEWGWPARNIGAQPYLTTAASDTEPQWLGVYTGGIQGILDDAAGDADGTGS